MKWMLACVGLVLLGLVQPAHAKEPAKQEAQTGDWPAMRDATFELVWTTVRDTYYDPMWGGVDWPAVRGRYSPRVHETHDATELRSVLKSMLGELRQTHFAVYPGSSEKIWGDGGAATEAGDTGMELVPVNGELAVARVSPDGAAAKAGVRPGDVVEAIDGTRLSDALESLPVEHLTAARRDFMLHYAARHLMQRAAGERVMLRIRRESETGSGLASRRLPPRTRLFKIRLTLAPSTAHWSVPIGSMPSLPYSCEATTRPGRPAYVRFDLFVPELMDELRRFVTSLPPDTPGLIIDVRGNPGGVGMMAAGLAGLLTRERINLGTMQMRSGHFNFLAYPQPQAFTGPVAVLVDARSASTSELFAGGLGEAGLARLFGETTAGAALPSFFRELPDGDLFQYAIADLRTPKGHLLEGHGVAPDTHVAPTLADLRAGRDPAREAAEVWCLSRQGAKVPAPARPSGTAAAETRTTP